MKVRTYIQLALATTLCLLLNTAYSFESDISYLGHLSDGGTGNLGETIEGLNGAIDVVVSSSGKVYVAGFVDDAVAVFNLNRTTNQLEQIQVLKNGVNNVSGLNGISALTLSPDESQLYATSLYDKSFVIFNVDSFGLLSQAQVITEGDVDSFGRTVDGMSRLFDSGNTDILVSDDGVFVYVANQYAGGAIFKKDPSDSSFYSIEPNQHSGMVGTRAGLLTSNHQDLYTVNTTIDAVYHYSRDAQSGLLTFVQRFDDGSTYPELTNPRHLSSNTNESILVVSGITDDSLVVFDRATESGVITYSYALKNGSTDSLGNTISSIVGPIGTVFNHIGTKLVSANYDADSLGLFSSQSGTPISFAGALDSNETIGSSPLLNFDGPRAINFTQDDQYFVVVSYVSDSIHLFYDQDVDEDGIVNDQDPTPNGEGSGNIGDQDGDGVADEDDAFPTDPTEWTDQDGDGVGDNSDAFPTNPEEWSDQDGDNVGDNTDAFPADPAEWSDQDGDGVGDRTDPEVNFVSVSVQSPPGKITISPGSSTLLQTKVSYFARDTLPENVTVNQELKPLYSQTNDLVVSNIISDTRMVTNSQSWAYEQNISAVSQGIYNLITTVDTENASEPAVSVQRIEVRELTDDFEIEIYGHLPLAIKPNTSTEVTFVVNTRSENLSDQINVDLEGDLTITLNDDGQDGDLVPGDGKYSGSLTVNSNGLEIGECLTFLAKGTRSTVIKTSEASQICVSSFDTVPIIGPITGTITGPNVGEEYVSDEMLLQVANGTSEGRVNQIVQSIGGNVFGWIPMLNTVFIKMPQSFSSYAEIQSKIDTLQAYPEVISADGNGIVNIESSSNFVPKDSLYSHQWGLEKVEANAAWSLGYHGNQIIAVVDTGIDYLHPDLKNKVVEGVDLVYGLEPIDLEGHGTKVAGVIAAESNNSQGIAGVTWYSKLMPIRAVDVRDETRSSDAYGLAGISIAVMKGASVINVSLGSYQASAEKYFCPAVALAESKGIVVVSSAGNALNGDINPTRHYPSQCKGAISVGATTYQDERKSDSNIGPKVSLGAPGESIYTTVSSPGRLYDRFGGTSMAAPFVSGAIAIVMDKFPNYTPIQAAQRILETADPLDASEGLGVGRLNIFRAVADHGLLTYSPSSNVNFIAPGASEWIATTLTEGEAGNLDWKGLYIDGLATEVISWFGPKSRYFGGIDKTYVELNSELEITSTLEYGAFVFREGKVLAKAPGPVLGAGIHKDSDNKKWIIVGTINPVPGLEPSSYTADIFYIKPFEYSLDSSLYDPESHPNGWREVARLPKQSEEELHGGWFFNGNADEAVGLRYVMEELAPSNQFSKLDLQQRTFSLSSLNSGTISVQGDIVAGAVDYLDSNQLTLNFTSEKWLSINDGPPLIPNEELNTYCFDHTGYYAGDDCAFGTATDGTITNKGIFGYIISRASEQPGGVFVYGLDLRSETLLYSITDLDPDHNTYLYPRDVTYRIRHNGSVLYSEDLGTVDCVSITGYYDRFLFDYEWGSFDFIPDVYASFDRKLHCPTYSFDYLAEMGPIPEFQFAVGIFGELLSSQTFFDDSIRNFAYPSANLSELFGPSISTNIEAFSKISVY